MKQQEVLCAFSPMLGVELRLRRALSSFATPVIPPTQLVVRSNSAYTKRHAHPKYSAY
jgi:hypothetical protein